MRGYVLDCGKYTDDDFENDDLYLGNERICIRLREVHR